MVHTFTCLGAYIAVDVNSGAVHVLDKTAYDVLSLLDKPMADSCPEELYGQLSAYSREEVDGAWAELLELQKGGLLFTDDDYIDPEAAVLMQKDDAFVPKVIIGLDTKKGAPDHLKLHEVITSGTSDLKRGNIIMSYLIARNLRAGIGQKILLHSPTNLAKLVKRGRNGKLEVAKNLEMYLPSEYTITGISNFNKYDFDRDFLFMHIDDACELLDLDLGVASAIYIWVPDPFNMNGFLKKMRENLALQAPSTFIESWKEINGRLLGVLQVEKNMQFFLLIFIVLVAAFSITNTLITTVIQKTKEIGLLKAMGASSGMVMRIFILQGFFVGLIGTGAGMILGSLVVRYRMLILKTLRVVTGQEIFPAEMYYFNELPAQIIMTDLVWIALISIVLCTFGGVIPAFRAAKLDPSRALRYE